MQPNTDPPKFLFPRKAIRDIIAQEAEKHGVTFADILAKDRRPSVAMARQIAMWRARVEVGKSYAVIGQEFKRDHSTVINSVKKMDAQNGRAKWAVERLKAYEAGEVTYMGAPCVHGHNGERRTSSGKCRQCERERYRADEYRKSRAKERTEPQPVKETKREDKSAQRDARIVKLLQQGLGASEIAERIGLSANRVNERIGILRKTRDDIPSVEVLKMRSRFR